MKIIACGDLHITDKMPYSNDENDRSKELVNAWEKVCKVANDNKINTIIITGDIFDDINVSPKAFGIFNDLMVISQGLRKIVIAGNHEIDERGNALIKELGVYCGFDEGDNEIISIFPGNKFYLYRLDLNTILYMFDYHHSYHELKLNIRKAINETRISNRSIFLGHQPVEGMEMRDTKVCTQGIPKTWFSEKGLIGNYFDVALLGDFHKSQTINHDTQAYYTGSLIQNSFKDEGSDPCFMYLDLDEQGGETIDFIPTDCPKFHTVRFIEGKEQPKLQHIPKNGYIKITSVGTKEYVDSLNISKLSVDINEKHRPIKLIVSNPTITCTIPNPEDIQMSRLMSDEELVEKIISKDENDLLPDDLKYEIGVKYLRKAKKERKRQ